MVRSSSAALATSNHYLQESVNRRLAMSVSVQTDRQAEWASGEYTTSHASHRSVSLKWCCGPTTNRRL